MGFITPLIAGICLIIGVAMLLSKRAKAMVPSIFGISKNFIMIGLIAIGLISGGVAWVQGAMPLASLTGADTSALPEATLQSCIYSAGSYGGGTNITVRQDPNSNNVVYLDVDESAWDGPSGREVDINFTCTRNAEDVSEEQAIKILVDGAKGIRSEISTSDANEYYLFETSTRLSPVFAGDYTQTVYPEGDGNTATTTDTKEYDFIEFSEGKKSQTLHIIGDLDRTTFTKLNNYTMKTIEIRTEDGTVWGKIIVNKVP